MRKLMAINKVCLVGVTCAISFLWSDVRLTRFILRPATIANFEATSRNRLPLDFVEAVLLGGNNDTGNTSRMTTPRQRQQPTISAPPENMTSTIFSSSVAVSSVPWELDDILDLIYNETDKGSKVQNTTITKTTTTIRIPKQIFMYWDQGWDVAPPLQQLARQIARQLNPLYELHALDRDSMEKRSNRRLLLNDTFFATLSIQARSDVYRTLLLYRYGGIWIDATVFVNKPLDDWLGEHVNRSYTDLWGFRKPKPRKMRRPIDPFMGSWFLAAPRRSRTVANILRVIYNEPHRLKREYFWWHRIVSELAQHHDMINSDDATTTTMIRKSLFSDNVLPSMNPCLQRISTWKQSAPVIKKRSSKQFAMVFSVWKDCCGDSDANTGVGDVNRTDLCTHFSCDILAVNFDLAKDIEETYNRNESSWLQSFETPQYQIERTKRTTVPPR